MAVALAWRWRGSAGRRREQASASCKEQVDRRHAATRKAQLKRARLQAKTDQLVRAGWSGLVARFNAL